MSIEGLGRVVVVIPTYNEASNLAWIVDRLRRAQPGVDVLVVDDDSPDGTGRIADELAAADAQVQRAAPHRQGRPRRGVPARLRPRAGRRLRRDRRDGRRRLPPARAAATGSSRRSCTPTWSSARAGCPAARWSTGRRGASCSPAAATSTCGSCSASACATRPPASGCSAARRWRRSTWPRCASTGYVFQTDLVARTLAAGLTVREVPIEFVERVRGDSKMSGAVAAESLKRITVWGSRERTAQARRALRRRRP